MDASVRYVCNRYIYIYKYENMIASRLRGRPKTGATQVELLLCWR